MQYEGVHQRNSKSLFDFGGPQMSKQNMNNDFIETIYSTYSRQCQYSIHHSIHTAMIVRFQRTSHKALVLAALGLWAFCCNNGPSSASVVVVVRAFTNSVPSSRRIFSRTTPPAPTATTLLSNEQQQQHDDIDTDTAEYPQPFSDGDLVAQSFRERYSDVLPEWLLAKCAACGWTHPTRIQERVLDVVLRDATVDCIVQAETGSGKTLAFLLPALARIDPDRQAVQAVIVVPTRELGLQVARVAKRLASSASSSSSSSSTNSSTRNIMCMSVLQGSRNRRQRAWAWSEPPQLVIGTVVELCDMIRLGGIQRCNALQYLVVDEVDACLLNNGGNIAMTASSNNNAIANTGTPLHELLSKYLSPSFDDGTDAVAADRSVLAAASISNNNNKNNKKNKKPRLSNHRQTIFCSATIPQHRHFLKQCVQNQWMTNTANNNNNNNNNANKSPMSISLRPGEQLLPPQLQHAYMVCASTDKKLAALRRLLKQIFAAAVNDEQPKKVLVFAEHHRPLEEMAKVLARDCNGVYWNEARALATTTHDKMNWQSVVSVLRYEDSLSERAVAMDAFRGEARSTTAAGAPDALAPILNYSNNNDIALRVLLSSDLAARGLDIVDTTHVIHLDLPDTADTYVHRAGRTGRLGRPGQVVSIVTPQQEFVLERLANKLQLLGGDKQMTCLGRQQKQKDKSNVSSQD